MNSNSNNETKFFMAKPRMTRLLNLEKQFSNENGLGNQLRPQVYRETTLICLEHSGTGPLEVRSRRRNRCRDSNRILTREFKDFSGVDQAILATFGLAGAFQPDNTVPCQTVALILTKFDLDKKKLFKTIIVVNFSRQITM